MIDRWMDDNLNFALFCCVSDINVYNISFRLDIGCVICKYR